MQNELNVKMTRELAQAVGDALAQLPCGKFAALYLEFVRVSNAAAQEEAAARPKADHGEPSDG